MSRIMTDITPLAATRKRLVSAEQVRNANTADDLYDGIEDLRLEIADELRGAAPEGERHDALLECMMALRQAAEAAYKARCAYRHALQIYVVEQQETV